MELSLNKILLKRLLLDQVKVFEFEILCFIQFLQNVQLQKSSLSFYSTCLFLMENRNVIVENNP